MHQIETSQSILAAYQLTGLHMKTSLYQVIMIAQLMLHPYVLPYVYLIQINVLILRLLFWESYFARIVHNSFVCLFVCLFVLRGDFCSIYIVGVLYSYWEGFLNLLIKHFNRNWFFKSCSYTCLSRIFWPIFLNESCL